MQHCYEQANHLNQVAIFTQPHARMHELVHSWQNGAAELLLSCVLRKKAAMHVTLRHTRLGRPYTRTCRAPTRLNLSGRSSDPSATTLTRCCSVAQQADLGHLAALMNMHAACKILGWHSWPPQKTHGPCNCTRRSHF
mmetsp:Transcript_16841/g.44066  ORF Transcript_16841/g.44066 Transcript_16841/m.44066 type:complete len:138 (-) Transcript_16841:1758-2171(-)